MIDRDPGFTQVLANRLGALGCEHRPLSTPATVETLVAMRLNALVLDLAVIGPDSWDYLERCCARLPGLAVIVCTGPSSVAQRVRGLRLGADAWMTKPCHPEELICVIEAAVRRHRRHELPQIDLSATVGEITVRPDLYQAYVGEQSLELTAREFEILQLLAQSDRVLRREEIYERVWGYAMAHGDRSVDVFVRKLARSCGRCPVLELHPHALRRRLSIRSRVRSGSYGGGDPGGGVGPRAPTGAQSAELDSAANPSSPVACTVRFRPRRPPCRGPSLADRSQVVHILVTSR